LWATDILFCRLKNVILRVADARKPICTTIVTKSASDFSTLVLPFPLRIVVQYEHREAASAGHRSICQARADVLRRCFTCDQEGMCILKPHTPQYFWILMLCGASWRVETFGNRTKTGSPPATLSGVTFKKVQVVSKPAGTHMEINREYVGNAQLYNGRHDPGATINVGPGCAIYPIEILSPGCRYSQSDCFRHGYPASGALVALVRFRSSTPSKR
jgi:hypothetical protein